MKLDSLARQSLLFGASPIQPLERLSEHLGGLIDLAQRGEITPDSNVLYAHLGGAALSAYAGVVT